MGATNEANAHWHLQNFQSFVTGRTGVCDHRSLAPSRTTSRQHAAGAAAASLISTRVAAMVQPASPFAPGKLSPLVEVFFSIKQALLSVVICPLNIVQLTSTVMAATRLHVWCVTGW